VTAQSKPPDAAFGVPQESPDRYAATICIATRSDCYADILRAEAAVRVAKAQLLQMLSGCHEVLVERLLRFLLRCFLRLLRFLRFLGHVALRDPQSWINASHLDMHAFKIHHNRKIDTERFEEGKRPSRRRDHDEVAWRFYLKPAAI
jgi:hypothetical protein